jgi:signal transduction histidine kinase
VKQAVDLVDAYAAALREYLAGGHETALLRAYELGREMMEAGRGVVEVVRTHEEAVERLARIRAVDRVTNARPADVLAEALGSYEMAFRGFQEANASLRTLTGNLEREVEQRTEELNRGLAELEAIDAERVRLLQRVVNAQEQERRRIAEDLHDDSIQAMTAVGLRLDALRRRLEEQVEPAILDQLAAAVSQAIGRLRRLMFELRPPELDREGLVPALRLLAGETLGDAGCQCRVEDRLAAEPPVEVREHLYRIVQEALANVRKHAQASHVSIEVVTRSDGVAVAVHDDGVGFDPAQVGRSRPGHLGLTAMRERVAMLGGTIELVSAVERGSRFTLKLPVRLRRR